jgi:hypothetical protein
MRRDRDRATVASPDAPRRHSDGSRRPKRSGSRRRPGQSAATTPSLAEPSAHGRLPPTRLWDATAQPAAWRRVVDWRGARRRLLGVGGYLLGHNVGQSNERDNFDAGAPGYNVIYQQGFAAGKGQGTQQGQAQGAAQGEQTGLEQGEQTGLEQGKQQGTSAGATQALGGFTTWAPGAPYVVKVKAGSSSVPYQISSRTQMQPDTDYALCQDDPSQVCTVKAASDTDSKSGTDTTTTP